MGYILFFVGIITALAGLGIGLTMTPLSAPQQAVQSLDVLIGIAGLILAGIGYIAEHARLALKVLQNPLEVTAPQQQEGAQPAE